MDFRARLYSAPLLPFEKQIIELIGCTEQEYRFFAAEAIRRGRLHPAGYDHIPEIYAGPIVPALISLAVGIAFSAVSYLLTPKPKQPAARDGASSSQLDSINGGTRFSPTFGFDSQAELASYGDPIPIIFGRYTGSTGGMLVSPRLVWSRMFSYGTQQAVKLLMVVGEQGYSAGQVPQGIDTPSLDGIFLGNTPLDAVHDSQFAFYWRRNTTLSGSGRIFASHLRYGSRGGPATGDPETFNDIFSCPTGAAENDTGFSSAHQLSNNSQFGCYETIPNGTGYRVNWRVVSVPNVGDAEENDPRGQLSLERTKIAGLDGKNLGDFDNTKSFRKAARDYAMRGIGRNWSRRMGIVSCDGQKVPLSEGNRVVRVSVLSRIIFKISAKRLPPSYFSDRVTVDDINSALDEQRIVADDSLQIGELFMIGRTMWKVVSRSIPQWRPENNQDQLVTLECIELLGPNLIGIVAEEALDRDFLWDNVPNNFGMGVAFFPLQKVSLATVRNTRDCEVTEIGLKSSVYQRLNGLCNFQSVPSPAQLIESDDDKINIGSGTVSTYVRRASAFTIYVRPASFQPGTSTPYEWVPLGENFVVVGNKPIDLYNFLRIKHPSRSRWEFRIVPKNAADLAFNDSDTSRYWQLNANASLDNASSSILSSTYPTTYGTFVITGVGTLVARNAIRSNVEFTSKPTLSRSQTTATSPEQVAINSYYPADVNSDVAVTSTSVSGFVTVPNAGYNIGIGPAFGHQLFGGFSLYPGVVEGASTYKVIRHYIADRWIDIGYTIRKDRLPDGHYSGRLYRWQITGHVVVGSSSNWAGVTEFQTLTQITADNPFKNPPGFPPFEQVGETHRVTGTRGQTIGRLQGFLEQVLGPARNYNDGFTLSANVTFEAGNKKLTLRLTSRTEPISNHWTGVSRWWSNPTVDVVKEPSLTTSNWVIGDKFIIYRGLSAGNPFGPVNFIVGLEFIVNSVTIQQQVFEETLTAERVFESQSQYGDLSFYGSLVEKSNNNAPEHSVAYINEIVGNDPTPSYDRLTVCGLALKASRNFSSLDQLRVWLPTGIPVIRFHPDDGGDLPLSNVGRIGPSNLFCDLVYYLLTDDVAGLGKVLGISGTDPQIINTADLTTTAKFLKANRLFFDGSITASSNLRQFIADTAPNFLCSFVISDGKFSLLPSLPTDSAGRISDSPVTIKQLFTSGNIVENSFSLEYVPAEERKPFQAVVRYREEARNQLAQERNVVVRWADENQYAPVESFDLTQYCTSAEHAELVGRYFLSLRKRVTHTIRFKTLPYGISIAPGDYVKVVTEASPYNAARNGSISATGQITSATAIGDGNYQVLYYQPGGDEVVSATMTVAGGTVTQTALHGSIFTLVETTTSENVYMIEQITVDEDGTAQIVASEFPCNPSRISLMAQDLLPQSRGLFVIES